MANVNLGDKARDTVSGFSGVCVARTEWLNGCWRMTLQPQGLDKDGKPQETQTFDDFQLEVIEQNLQPVGSKETGGPRDEPAQARDPPAACEAKPTINHHTGANMKSSSQEITTIIGTALGGGYYAGRIQIGDQVYALIVAPKAEGEHDGIRWIDNYQDVPGAKSYNDGLSNTTAMAEAGSELAKWARDLRINDYADWYLPSQDELEVIYRNLKPTTETNSCYARSGINLSAVPPTRPYTPESPVQTQAEAFQTGGDQAFEEAWYWSSTQHASYSTNAWGQYFDLGDQGYYGKSFEGRARAVRRLPI